MRGHFVRSGWLGAAALTLCAHVALAQRAGDDKAPPMWVIDYSASSIEFTGSQSGAPFTGRFERWDADIRFDAGGQPTGSFDVRIDLTSVSSGDSDRDTTLADPDWFDSAAHPQANYSASTFVATDATDDNDLPFTTNDGQLTIKDQPAPARLTFRVDENGARRTLVGKTRLNRLDFNVGVGDWTDPEWVAHEVTVEVRIEASTPP
ncbi:MAG: YceI family protein [Pseudomonadota bacterium]